jgi:hypothetical protein
MSPSAGLDTVASVEVITSPGVHFVEPAVHAESESALVESSKDAYAPEEDNGREGHPLLTIGGESYRPSPASPSPALESEEEEKLPIALRVFSEVSPG